MSQRMQRMMQQMQHPNRTHYTEAQKAEALKLLAEFGRTEASRRTGIPVGTIAAWGSRNGVSAPVEQPARRAQVEARALTIAEHKATLARDLAYLSTRATSKLIERIDLDAISAKDLVAALTAAIDRLQLLTGEATTRTEVITERTPEAEAEVAQVLSLIRSAA